MRHKVPYPSALETPAWDNVAMTGKRRAQPCHDGRQDMAMVIATLPEGLVNVRWRTVAASAARASPTGRSRQNARTSSNLESRMRFPCRARREQDNLGSAL